MERVRRFAGLFLDGHPFSSFSLGESYGKTYYDGKYLLNNVRAAFRSLPYCGLRFLCLAPAVGLLLQKQKLIELPASDLNFLGFRHKVH